MREHNGTAGPGDGGLAAQAFLYLHGELDGPEAAAFEQQLGANQAAREALGQAVQQAYSLAGGGLRPDPAYRTAVRRQLRPGWWRRLAAQRRYRGHPALWAAAGAAATVLVTVGLELFRPADVSPPADVVASAEVAPSPPPSPVAPTAAVASYWADHNGAEHLVKARDEELRRRSRTDGWQRRNKRMQ